MNFNNQLPLMAMNFNGNYIEEEIPSYQTFKVTGREVISNELILEDVHEGTITLDNRLPQRELEVTYVLKRTTSEQLQADYKALRKLLTTNEQVPITFSDDPDTVYFGRLSAMDTVPDDSNTIVSTFVIHCDTPYKFSDLVTTNGSVEIDTFYPTLPEQIILTIDSTTNNIEITNGSERITATGTFNAESEVVIKFKKEEVIMTVNGAEATYMIDLHSDLENFLLKEGQTVTSTQGTIELKVRERWL